MNYLICKFCQINFHRENNTGEYVNILHKILMNGDKFKNVQIICSYRMPELFDFVINVGSLFLVPTYIYLNLIIFLYFSISKRQKNKIVSS